MKIKKIMVAVAMAMAISPIALADDESLNIWEERWQQIKATGEIDRYERHWHVCGIKFRLRSYSDLFTCLDSLDKRSAAEFPDGANRRYAAFFSGWLRAQALFDIGQFEDALNTAEFSINALQDDEKQKLRPSTNSPIRQFALTIGGPGSGNFELADHEAKNGNFVNNPARIYFAPHSVYNSLLGLAMRSAFKVGDTARAERYEKELLVRGKSPAQFKGQAVTRHDVKVLSELLLPYHVQGRYKDVVDTAELVIVPLGGSSITGSGTAIILTDGISPFYRMVSNTRIKLWGYAIPTLKKEGAEQIDVEFIQNSRFAGDLALYRATFKDARQADEDLAKRLSRSSNISAGNLLANAVTAVVTPIVPAMVAWNSLSVPRLQEFEVSLDEVTMQFIWASSLSRTGSVDRAQLLLDGLLSRKELKSLGGLYWQVLYERGLVAQKKGDSEAALQYFKDSTEAIERVRSSISAEAAKIGFSGDKQSVYKDLVNALAAKGDWPGAFEYAERAKSRALVDMLSQQAKFSPPIMSDEKIVALLAQAERPEPPLPIFEVDGQTRATAIAVRQELGKVAPEAASLISVTAVSLPDIAARLGPQETLINYFSTGDSLYAFVVNGTTIKGYKLDAKGLEEEIRSYREALEATDPKAVDQGRRLHTRLISPIASEIKGKKLTISPHAALHYLPFGALSDGKKYLLESYSLRIIPSANTLAYVHADKPNKAGKVLALGNPDLNDPKLDLPAAQNEAQQVVSMFPASKALIRKDATKAAVKELGNGFSIIHIASHGQFDADAPLNSGLLLAKSGSEDGRLTVGDLYTMRLDTELVTLSACETALGKVASGDDVVGLTRGFLYAGARSIVASLWQVDDAATAKLMTAFYKNLALKLDQRESLRLAQMETKKAYPHPFYWAAFQITGAAN